MIVLTIERTGDVPKLAKRKFNAILKLSWQKVGEKDFRLRTPEHFTKAGGRKYKYARRSSAYVKAKQRKSAPDAAQAGNPLVWTGQSRALAKIMNVRATSKGVVERIQARGLNRRPKGGTINMAEEVRRRTDGDKKQIETWMRDQLTRRTRKFT